VNLKEKKEKMHRVSHFDAVESNFKPKPLAPYRPSRSWRSFQPSVLIDTPIPTSVLDHITNAEDIYETSLFSTGTQLSLFHPNLDWEIRILKSFHHEALESVDPATTLSVTEFLSRWKSVLNQGSGNGIARQFIV
jgi:hypothetical protein